MVLGRKPIHNRLVQSHLLHSKWVPLLVVQVFFQVEKGVEEYVSHPAALQIAERYLTWRKSKSGAMAECSHMGQDRKLSGKGLKVPC